MTARKPLLRLAACAALTVLTVAAAPSASAQTEPSGPAASAEAYGLHVDATLIDAVAPVPVEVGPLAWASQEYPPGAAEPSEASVVDVGPIPEDSGALVEHIGVLQSIAGASGEPQATASSEAAEVALFDAGPGPTELPLIEADAIEVIANADCSDELPSAEVTFVNLRIGDQSFGEQFTPAPNTVIPLGVLTIILNEQHQAFDGRGIVVNALHITSTSDAAPLFHGDIVVSHAMATVACPDGPGSGGGDNPIKMVKTAEPNVVEPGGQLTYTATVTNDSEDDCLVNRFIEHLNPAFEFVSTAGDFGDEPDDIKQRPNGGQDVILGNGTTIPAGESFNQTFVVRARETAGAGVYYNNLEIFCSDQGNFVKGLDAPVQIVTEQPSPSPSPSESPDAPMPVTGGGPSPLWAVGTLVAAGLAVGARRLVRPTA